MTESDFDGAAFCWYTISSMSRFATLSVLALFGYGSVSCCKKRIRYR